MGGCKPRIVFISVLLPEPFSPTMVGNACKDPKAEILQNGLPIIADAEILTSELSHRPTSPTHALLFSTDRFFHHGEVGRTVCHIFVEVVECMESMVSTFDFSQRKILTIFEFYAVRPSMVRTQGGKPDHPPS